MQLIQSATTKLTLWYLALIMLVSISFSAVLYRVSSIEIGRNIPQQGGLFEIINPTKFETIRQAYVAESNARIRNNLILINLIMLGVGGAASYWLALRTLRPIQDAMEAQGRFVSDASHELRTPLTAMHTEIEVALREEKLSKADMRELLKSNLEEVGKLQGLSDRLLQLANGKDIPISVVALEEVAIDAMNRVLRSAQAKRITIENNIGRTRVRGNQESLTDLLSILLDNAIKYSPAGKHIVMSSAVDGKYTEIRLQDYGRGIKASELPYIFDRFYRADSSRSKEQVAGYGLGLSIAKKIVDMHDGGIEAESVPGKGTIFKVRIPLS